MCLGVRDLCSVGRLLLMSQGRTWGPCSSVQTPRLAACSVLESLFRDIPKCRWKWGSASRWLLGILLWQCRRAQLWWSYSSHKQTQDITYILSQDVLQRKNILCLYALRICKYSKYYYLYLNNGYVVGDLLPPVACVQGKREQNSCSFISQKSVRLKMARRDSNGCYRLREETCSGSGKYSLGP